MLLIGELPHVFFRVTLQHFLQLLNVILASSLNKFEEVLLIPEFIQCLLESE
jgi:hypothetical protein